MSKFTVIIPLLEWTDYFTQSVQSVLKSPNGNPVSSGIECIVVTRKGELLDRVRACIDSERITLLEENCETSASLFNRGIAAAHGDYIARLSPENVLIEGWESLVQTSIDSSPRVDLVYGSGCRVDENAVASKPIRNRCPSPKSLRSKLFLVPDAVFYHHSLFEKFGNFDPSFALRSEFEFLLRVASATLCYKRVDSALVGVRFTTNRRRATPEEVDLILAETDEEIKILRSKGVKPGDSLLLFRGALEAERLGLTRLSSTAFDKHVFKTAMHQRKQDVQTKPERLLAAINMSWSHALTESNFLLKRPRFATRFIRGTSSGSRKKPVAQQQVQKDRDDRPSRRIFQLRYDTPHPCRLEDFYFTQPRHRSTLSISIVTPNLNQGDFIERTIKSVLGQKYPKLEYIVQDGCSRDSSVEVIQRYDAFLSNWQSVKDRGQSHAINMGLERTTGDIMAYLNSDDLILPGSLDYVAAYFERNPHIDVVYGNRLLIDEQDRIINHWVLPSHDSDAIVWADFIPQETMFWRRSAWEAIGGCVDDSFHFAMDWDMILRFRSCGKRFAHIPRFLGAFRITDGQKTNQLLASVGVKEMGRLRKRELGYVPSEIEVGNRMKPYVKRQWFAEQRFNLSRSVASACGRLHDWEPSQYEVIPSFSKQAA